MDFSEQDIAVALERGEFVPYFQPLVELRSGQIAGFEVLARWLHPQHGVVTPDLFIPAIERAGWANALTIPLLRQTFAVAREVPAGIGFSVNFAPAQLHDYELPKLISQMAGESEFDLQRLTVELTESALLGDLKLAGEVARDLKALGVKLALDDFGTGYSSLLHLQALPFDELKVDGSFVRTMVHSRQSRKITSAVVSLGQSLGLRTVAEGVEEVCQAELLIWQGCSLAQGWLYERAVPSNQIQATLAKTLPVIQAAKAASPEMSDAAIVVDARPADRVSQLRAIYDGVPVGLCFVDRELTYASLNQRLAEMHGLTIEAHLGRKVQDVVPVEFAQIECALLRSLEGEAVSTLELSLPATHAGEPPATWMVSFQPARDEANEVIGVLVSVSDITQKKLSEEALRDSEARLRAVLNAAPVGIVVAHAPSGEVVLANPCARVLFGPSLQSGACWHKVAEELLRQSNSEYPVEQMPMVRALMHGESTRNFELPYTKATGESVWLSLSATPIQADDEQITGAVLTVQTVDHPKRHEWNVVRMEEIGHSATERTVAGVAGALLGLEAPGPRTRPKSSGGEFKERHDAA